MIVESKEGREAIMGDVVIDATGDLDVAASAGATFSKDSYMVTTVFRLGGVDTDEAERFQFEEPERHAVLDLEARRVIGGSWDYWWLKTPLPGIVWCNCPHMTGLDGMKVTDLTRAEFEGRRRIHAMVEHVRAKLPGFANCYIVDVAPQTGVRQTRMLRGRIRGRRNPTSPAACIFPTASPEAVTTTRRIVRCYRAKSTSFWSPGATIPQPRRHKRFRVKFRPAWQWAKPRAWRRRWRCRPALRCGTST